MAARFVIGLAVGSAALVVPLYLSEIAPTEIRGAIGSLNQLMIVVGILAAFIVNAILASSGDWRLMLGLAAVPSLVLLVGMLLHAGDAALPREGGRARRRRARSSRRSRRGRVGEEIRSRRSRRSARSRSRRRAAARGLLKQPWVRPALLVAIGLAVFQQLIGINTIIYYAPTTLTSVGFGAGVGDLR